MSEIELRMQVAEGVERLVVRNGWSVEEGARHLDVNPSELEDLLLGFPVPMDALVSVTAAVDRMLGA